MTKSTHRARPPHALRQRHSGEVLMDVIVALVSVRYINRN